jgi:hypothetical protein
VYRRWGAEGAAKTGGGGRNRSGAGLWVGLTNSVEYSFGEKDRSSVRLSNRSFCVQWIGYSNNIHPGDKHDGGKEDLVAP